MIKIFHECLTDLFFLIYSVLNNLGAKRVLIKSKKLVNFDFKQKPRSKKIIYKKKNSESLEGSPPPEFPNTLTQGRIWGGGGGGGGLRSLFSGIRPPADPKGSPFLLF